MSMNVQIKIDAPSALPTIAGVEAALAKLEAKGPAVGNALSDGLAKSGTAAEKAKQSTESLTDRMAKLAGAGKAFSGLEDAFRREADLLEKIKGPAREYEADLRALDMLLQKNTISTKEYADQVANLNHRIGERPKPPAAPTPHEGGLRIEGLGGAIAGQFGELGTVFEGLASKGAVEAAALAGMAVEAVHLGDEYIHLANKALKFVDAQHDSNTIISEQLSLAGSLHSSLDSTMEAYDAVRDGTDELNLSHEKQIELTKGISEAVMLSGKSVGEATGLMQRLSYAFASGSISGREMKGIMREYPEIAETWTHQLGKTRHELQRMADDGTLSVKQLMNTFSTGGEELDQKFGKRSVALGETWQHFKDVLVVTIGKLIEGTGAIKMLGDALTFVASALGAVADGFKAASDAVGWISKHVSDVGSAFKSAAGTVLGFTNITADLSKVKQTLSEEDKHQIENAKKFYEALQNQTGQFAFLAEKAEVVQGFYDAFTTVPQKIDKITAAAKDLGMQLGLVADAWNADLSAFGRSSKLVMDHAAAIGEAKKQLAALSASGMGGDAQAKMYRELMTTINDGRLPAMIKVLDSLHDPMRTYKEDLAATNALHKSGAISAQDYAFKLMEIQKSDPGLQRFNAVLADQVKRFDDAAAAAKKYRDAANLGFASPASIGMTGPQFAQTNRDALGDAAIFKDNSAGEDAKIDAQAKAYQAALDSVQGPASKFNEEMAKLNELKDHGILVGDRYNEVTGALREKFGAAVSPAEKLHKRMTELKDLLHATAINFDDYQRAVKEITKEQEKLADSGTTMGAGFSRGWHSIRDEVNDTASTISTSMKSAFDGINQNIVDMVTTGTADWGKLAKTIEGDLAKIALQTLEKSAIEGLTSHVTDVASSVATGTATGASAASVMTAAAPAIGALIGTSAAAIMAAGAATAGATQGIASAGVGAAATAIGSSWSGSETLIHAANGYSAKVGGSAGVDTKLFAAMVSPGETVSIRTPEQRAAEGGGGEKPAVHIHNSFGDVRAELASAVSSGALDMHVINLIKRNKVMVQTLIRK